jgi:diaminohydroxyphosphoribosylaminopyrimidine deaminase / 5-amino-6-(5-phosphoribosylamino)uracil reductase
VLADEPKLTARGVGATRQPRRLAFGRPPLPSESDLELRAGPIEDELRALAGEGVQSLLLEGGPRLAERFLRADLVDKLVLFIAPVLGGGGPAFVPMLDRPVEMERLTTARSGDDIVLSGYVHEP